MVKLQQGHPQTIARYSLVPANEVGISVISVEEQLSSWCTLIRQAKKPEDAARGYFSLAQNVSSFAQFEILPYPVVAIARFEQLKRMKLGVRAPDLRIAAIVLEHPWEHSCHPKYSRLQGDTRPRNRRLGPTLTRPLSDYLNDSGSILTLLPAPTPSLYY
jgi:hypothetical protein